MNKFIILSLLFAFVAAAPAQYENEDTRVANSLVESNEIFDTPMLDFEVDYELNRNQFIELMPAELRDKLVEKLRKAAIEIKIKVHLLIEKIDNEILKLGDIYAKTHSGFYKGKLWTQVHSLKLLRVVTMAGLDKFDKYIVSENSRVLEKLVRCVENLFETKFFKFVTIAKTTLKLLSAIQESRE